MQCNDVVRYKYFGGPCYLHLQGEVIGYWYRYWVHSDFLSRIVWSWYRDGIELCVGSWPDSSCNSQTFLDYPCWYPL